MTRFRNAVRKMRTLFARAAKPNRPLGQGLLQCQSVSHGAMVRQPVRPRSLRVRTGRGFVADMRATAGFTLTEIVVAVVILGVMAATVGYFVTGAREAAVLNAKTANVNTINKLFADVVASGRNPKELVDKDTKFSDGNNLKAADIEAMRKGVEIPGTNIRFGLAAGTSITPDSYSFVVPTAGDHYVQTGTDDEDNPIYRWIAPPQIKHDGNPDTNP